MKEDRIRKAFENKNWNEIKVTDSWQILKIMAEFVDGFEKLAKIGPCVSIFGSARTKADHKYYQLTEEIARLLTKQGYGVMVIMNKPMLVIGGVQSPCKNPSLPFSIQIIPSIF